MPLMLNVLCRGAVPLSAIFVARFAGVPISFLRVLSLVPLRVFLYVVTVGL